VRFVLVYLIILAYVSEVLVVAGHDALGLL
jgi:hypothetical protein